MPILKTRMALEFKRNIRLFLNVEAGITGLEALLSRIRSRSGVKTAPARSKAQTATAKLPMRLRNEVARAPAVAPSGSPAQQSDPLGENPPTFFLVGQAKSGTSWLMRLLHSHPEIFCRGEGKLFGKDSPNTLHGSLAHSKSFQTWLNRNPWTWKDRDPDLEDLVRVLVEYLMAEKARKTKKKLVGDKSPFSSTQVIEEIATICPGSKVIHIVRDGRDVAVSTVHHKWNNATDQGGPHELTPTQIAKRDAYRKDPSAFGASGESIFGEGEAAELAITWRTFVGRAIQDGPKLLDGDYDQLHYEDLLQRPEEEVGRLLRFLGADASGETVKRCVEMSSFEKWSESRGRGEEDPTSFYRKGIAGDWRNVFTENDKRVFKRAAGDLLIELGYEKDHDW